MNKILRLCDKIGFLRPVYSEKSLDHLNFGPTGELLVNNLKEEWIYTCVTNSNKNVFPFYRGSSPSLNISQDAKDSFIFVKNMLKGQLPFSLAEIRQHSVEIDALMGVASTESQQSIFKLRKGTIMRLIQFLPPADADRYFTTLQRERKKWWMKFSSSPGRFRLSEVIATGENASGADTSGSSHQFVQILSDFDWGTGVVETVRLWSPSSFAADENEFKVREGQRSVLPCALESVVTLDLAALVYLCDAVDARTGENLVMRLHRRIAPFKVSFSSSTSKPLVEKAYALAEHLTALLRKSGHSTLLLPDIGKQPLEAALANYNQMGVPFTVVITDSSLTDGIIFLHSRETSIQEQVHISQLVGYMGQLLQSN